MKHLKQPLQRTSAPISNAVPEGIPHRENTDDPVPAIEPRQLQRTLKNHDTEKLSPNVVQAMHGLYGNQQVQRLLGSAPQPVRRVMTAPNNVVQAVRYADSEMFKDGETQYRIVEIKEGYSETELNEEEKEEIRAYVVEDLSGEQFGFTSKDLEKFEKLDDITGEEWERRKKDKAGIETETVPFRDGRVFYDWEKGDATSAKGEKISEDYWGKKNEVGDLYKRQPLSAKDSRTSELTGGGGVEVQSGVDYLKQNKPGSDMTPGNFIKRVGGFSFRYINTEGRNKNLRWLQFLTTTNTKTDSEGESSEIPLTEGEAKHRVDHNARTHPYYDPGFQTDTEHTMFDDPEPNQGNFSTLISQGATKVVEVDRFDTFLIDSTSEDGSALFHAVIEVTFTCDTSEEPTEDGYPIHKTSKIIEQNIDTKLSKELSETLSAWKKQRDQK